MPGRTLALAAFLLLAAVPPAAAASSYVALSDPVVPEAGFAVHGDRLAWLRVSSDHVDLMLTDLGSLSERRLALAAPSPSDFGVESMAFDGRWIVWSDARTGDLDLQAYDLESRDLRRLTEAGADDEEVDVDGGRAVWSRSGRLLLQDLEDGAPVVLETGNGSAREPSLSGDNLAWVRIEGSERYLVWGRLNGTRLESVRELHRAVGAYAFAPQLHGDMVVWTSKQAVSGRVGQAAYVGWLTNGTVGMLTQAGTAVPQVETDGERIAWLAGTTVHSYDLSTGASTDLQQSATRFALAPGGVVAWSLPQVAALGTLYAPPGSESAHGLPGPSLALAAAALALAARRR